VATDPISLRAMLMGLRQGSGCTSSLREPWRVNGPSNRSPPAPRRMPNINSFWSWRTPAVCRPTEKKHYYNHHRRHASLCYQPPALLRLPPLPHRINDSRSPSTSSLFGHYEFFITTSVLLDATDVIPAYGGYCPQPIFRCRSLPTAWLPGPAVRGAPLASEAWLFMTGTLPRQGTILSTAGGLPT